VIAELQGDRHQSLAQREDPEQQFRILPRADCTTRWLARSGEHWVTFPLPETKHVLSLSALVSRRALSPLRSRFSGHGRTS
jgi:hypothetical protein